MASIFSIKNKKERNRSFTLLEVSIVILLFMFAITIISGIYLNLVNSSILANDYYQALENVRLGTEKIWRILKYSWNPRLVNNGKGIIFNKKDCTTTTINFNQTISNLEYKEENYATTTIFDSDLVRVKDIIFATDTPNTPQTYAYFQYAPKLIVIYYDLEIKSKRGVTTSLVFEQAVAPLNSVYSTNLCE